MRTLEQGFRSPEELGISVEPVMPPVAEIQSQEVQELLEGDEIRPVSGPKVSSELRTGPFRADELAL